MPSAQWIVQKNDRISALIFNNFGYSQNAGLCPAMLALAIVVSVRRGNLFCLDFTDGSLYSWLTGSILLQIAPVTSNGKTGVLCNITFSVRKSRISARILDFSGFFSYTDVLKHVNYWRFRKLLNLKMAKKGTSKRFFKTPQINLPGPLWSGTWYCIC